MSENKKQSGAFYKKRKAQLERENKKQAKTFQRFFSESGHGLSRPPTPTGSATTENKSTSENLLVSNKQLRLHIVFCEYLHVNVNVFLRVRIL